MVWSLRCTLRLVLAANVLAATRAAADSSIRCDGGIVQVGDTRLDLLDKCGRPALLEQVTGDRTLVELIDGQAAAMTGVGAERWTYNFGSGQFIRVVTLDFGNVVAIHRGGYAIRRSSCAISDQVEPDATPRRSAWETASSTFWPGVVVRPLESSGERSAPSHCPES